MNKQIPSSLRSVAGALLPATVATLLIQACGGGAGSLPVLAQAEFAAVTPLSEADPIEGVWESRVQIRDCNSGQVLREFVGMNLFGRGGALTDTNEAPPASRGVGMGQWGRTAESERSYLIWQRIYEYDANGQRVSTRLVRRQLKLGHDGTTGQGEVSFLALDRNGVEIQRGCGQETSKRMLG
ncbi:hypothetical protein [Pelomonas sp. SE-A7]|uniref:hypothetical protein n=1 Tax=Pelomonas sp. SE-A7 TaxID=3054953 RepID=UPI00259C9BA4|nr:hypothetical protein [Pelomonas sp. SE-A7]MDM4767683.1 hypothetical protein [Pelomonas sp. SE-A7]